MSASRSSRGLIRQECADPAVPVLGHMFLSQVRLSARVAHRAIAWFRPDLLFSSTHPDCETGS